jgi:hypothetical protein
VKQSIGHFSIGLAVFLAAFANLASDRESLRQESARPGVNGEAASGAILSVNWASIPSRQPRARQMRLGSNTRHRRKNFEHAAAIMISAPGEGLIQRVTTRLELPVSLERSQMFGSDGVARLWDCFFYSQG